MVGKLQLKAKNSQGKLKNTGYLEIKNQSESIVDFNIYGDIVSDEWGKWSDDDTCPSDVSSFLKDLEGVEEINLHINSGGGSVFAGIAIYNMIKRHSAKVTAYIDGIAASIASVIACAADKIVMPKNATFMVHKPSNGYFWTSMNADELRKDAEILDTCQKTILATYMTKAKEGVTEDTINNLINAETWMVGSEATDYFDFDIEESVEAAACSSDYFNKYKNTPKDINKKAEIKDAVIDIMNDLKKEEEEKIKNDLLKDLDQFGI